MVLNYSSKINFFFILSKTIICCVFQLVHMYYYSDNQMKQRITQLIASVITRSVFSKSSLNGISLTAIGSCIINSSVLPIPRGNEPHLVIFHALLIVTGTTKADGAYLQRTFRPFSAKGLGLLDLLRVPSGNITTERLCSSIYLPIS